MIPCWQFLTYTRFKQRCVCLEQEKHIDSDSHCPFNRIPEASGREPDAYQKLTGRLTCCSAVFRKLPAGFQKAYRKLTGSCCFIWLLEKNIWYLKEASVSRLVCVSLHRRIVSGLCCSAAGLGDLTVTVIIHRVVAMYKKVGGWEGGGQGTELYGSWMRFYTMGGGVWRPVCDQILIKYDKHDQIHVQKIRTVIFSESTNPKSREFQKMSFSQILKI